MVAERRNARSNAKQVTQKLTTEYTEFVEGTENSWAVGVTYQVARRIAIWFTAGDLISRPYTARHLHDLLAFTEEN